MIGCMLTHEDYKEYCRQFKLVERYLRSKSASPDVVAYNICKLRGYYPERMQDIIKQAGFMFIENDMVYDQLEDMVSSDLGLFKNDRFLLAQRFIFPVRDMLGNTIAFIGWFPDEKKYITTPSRLFSKSCLFYGMEQLGTTGIGKQYYLCEGIFDSLSIRSLRIPAVAQMGINTSRVKCELYSIFGKIVATPDNDTQGRDVLTNDKWQLPSNCSYLRWVGDDSKDIDTLVNSYEAEDIRGLLLSEFTKRERIITERF